MEKYINNDTLVKNDLNLVLKDLAICSLCSNILIDPYMCMGCQKVYCKKCIDEWSKENKICPNKAKKCENPDYQKSIDKNNIICKLKFKCEKCENEFLYEELIKHVENCSGEKIPEKDEKVDEKTPTKRMKKITKEEADIIQKSGNKSINITCKNCIFIKY